MMLLFLQIFGAGGIYAWDGSESKKSAEDLRRQLAAVADAKQFVPGAIDGQQLGPRGDEVKSRLHLADSAETIAGSVDEEGRDLQVRKMPRPEFSRALRWMQRKRKEKEGLGKKRIRGGKE